jgi:RNA polymerase sigma-54 factor
MALELKQYLRVSQQLVMTPQLQQAIKLLQLSRMELQQAVREELEKNPLLEDVAEGSGAEEEPVPGEPDAADAAGERENAEANDKGPVDKIDWNYYFGEDVRAGGVMEREPDDEDGRPYYENISTRRTTLSEHLEGQLSLSDADAPLREIARYLIGNIDENGYLTMTASETAEALARPVEEVEQAIALVQTFDPPGIGARDLRECLLIQAREKGADFALPVRILTDHFDLFSRGDSAGIARRLKIGRETVREAFQKLVTLWPKPGRAFSGDDVQYVTPDAFVFKVDGQWVITLNEDGLPKLRLSSYYRRLLLSGGDLGKDAREYIRQKFSSAQWFIKSIYQRQRTIYKVVESIMKFQREFLDRGPMSLRPLTLRDIAEEIQMHESTVSRVTNGKYVYTPHGIFELKYFFNSGLDRDGGAETIASKSVKEKIREIINTEGREKPLSDQELMRLLRNQGIRIARRTVTKYRAQLGLLPSSKRKKFC